MECGRRLAHPGRTNGSDKDGDEFVGFALNARRGAEHAQLVQEPEPIKRLAQLLGSKADLVHEVCAALGVTRFLVVGAGGRRCADHLKRDVPREGTLGEFFCNANYCRGQLQQAFRNVATAGLAISPRYPSVA